jgi:hypothetical protein
MDALNARTLTSQLADDFGWLEQHCAGLPGHAPDAGRLRLAAALVRNCLAPMLDEQAPLPLHIAVVGGAGAGKSTVANLLSGAPAAEANAQAGFTRHPIAYTSTAGPIDWSARLGFLGPLHRLTESAPSSLDEDVYQIRRTTPTAAGVDFLKDFVVWDCPDMTTWAAAGTVSDAPVAALAAPVAQRPGYVTRLLEAAALADVIVYVASDERYNDEAPTQFLNLLLQAGKPVVVCLMKMREADAPALVEHFQKEVLSRLPAGVVATLAIPFLTPAQLADPAREAVRYRIPLLNQISALASPSPLAARRRAVLGALRYLIRQQDALLLAARNDVAALEGWKNLVLTGRDEFDERYRREYLTGEKFRGFDEALLRLMELLELPGVGKVVSGALYVLRTPYRLLMGAVGKALSRPESAVRPEGPVLEDALNGWIDLLRKEAARRTTTHPLWAHIAQGFNTGDLAGRARERFAQQFRSFQVGLAGEIDRTARAIYEQLETNPVQLNTLRGCKLGLDGLAVGTSLIMGGINWHDFILVPLAASVSHQLVELLGKQYVDAEREQARRRQGDLLSHQLSGPLADWLTRWPATGGTEFERLQQALLRIPEALKDLDARMRALLARPTVVTTPANGAAHAVAVPAIPQPVSGGEPS